VAVTSDVAGCEADLTVTLGEPLSPLVAGTTADWTIEITNNGPHDATGVSVNAAPDAAATFVANAGDCTLPFACALPNMAPNTTAEIVSSWSVAGDFDVSTLFEQMFAVTATEPDPGAGDEEATSSMVVVREADLVITLGVDPDPPVAGDIVTYMVDVLNNGPSDASGVAVELTLPEGWTVLESLGCAEDPTGGSPCTLGALPWGTTMMLEFDVAVPSDQSDAFTVSASVSADDTDPVPGDESASLETTPTRVADVEVVIVDDADPVLAGDALTYTVTVTNAGPSDTSGVELQLTPADEFTAETVDGCDASLLCAIGDLASGAVAEFTVPGTVALDASGLIVTSAAVTSGGNDPFENNNTDDEDTAVRLSADLSLAGSVAPDAPTATVDDAVMTLTAANAGPSPVDATVVITLPEGLDIVDIGACSQNQTVVSCDVALEVDGTAELVLNLTPADDASGLLDVVAVVEFSGEEAVPGDEEVTLTVDVQPAPAAGDDDDDDGGGGGAASGCDCQTSMADASGATSVWMLLGFAAMGLRRRR
jgi:uncharacterized repeat protein (TIGR01451 family)/MYXO-CTERM domain-containing protein